MHIFESARFVSDFEEIVRSGGKLIREHNTRPRNIRFKGSNDLVTETDEAVEILLKKKLAYLLPESDFLAEESSGMVQPGRMTWVIDPLDGTTNFAHGLPFVACSVALWCESQVVLGAVYLPLLDEFFLARRDGGATLNNLPIQVSASTELSQSLVATGFPYDINKYLQDILNNLEQVLPRTRGVRRPGSAALDLAYVACGRYDGFYEQALKPWDTAAGMLLVTEAGGRVSRYDEDMPYVLGADSILATNGRIHSKLAELLTEETFK